MKGLKALIKTPPTIEPSCWKAPVNKTNWLCHDNFVIVPAFYPILPGVSSHDGMSIHPRFSVHFQPKSGCQALLGHYIYSVLRVTVAIDLTQSDCLPRYWLID